MLDFDQKAESEPELTPIKNGWAAHGDGWAIHAGTRDEAIRRFRERHHFYQELDARILQFKLQHANGARDDSQHRDRR